MSDPEAENRLKRCLIASIEVLEEAINRIKPQRPTTADDSLTSPALDVNIHTFSLDQNEEAFMKDLKSDLENVLNEYLPYLSKHCRRYLLDFLCDRNYDYEKKAFTSRFNIGILDSLVRDLQGMLASVNALQSAWNGEPAAVEEFIKTYPSLKDKSGLWGTTLLYSAARNGHLGLVEYLIKSGKCSVNVQNQQHIIRVVPDAATTDDGYETNPSAGSTALHGACFYGYLNVVKFLIHRGADCFLKNHANETAIVNANKCPTILQYFREILILNYSFTSTDFPTDSIDEDNDRIVVDCFWEYQPLADQRWYSFSSGESSTLQESLQVKPDEEFQDEIHLHVRRGIYSVSLIKFLRSGKDADYTQQVAWVRCRGSSILNFHCYALWQIMLYTHPHAKSDPTLQMLQIPTIYNSTFEFHLQSWYFCDLRTNNQLDRTMKYRRKHIQLEIPSISNDPLRFDLQTFAFSNQQKTITGVIRWIPKLISNNSQNKLIDPNQYESLSNIDPIPLTTHKSKQISLTHQDSQFEEELDNYFNEHEDDSFFDNLSLTDNHQQIITDNPEKVFTLLLFNSHSFFLDS